MTSWIDFTYVMVALIVSGLLVYVMQKVEYDRWSRTDPLWLQWLRRLAFVSSAIVLLYSTQSTDWKLTCLLLVSASAIILAINAVALSLRTPPGTGSRVWVHPPQHHGFTRFVSRLMSLLHIHRR